MWKHILFRYQANSNCMWQSPEGGGGRNPYQICLAENDRPTLSRFRSINIAWNMTVYNPNFKAKMPQIMFGNIVEATNYDFWH